jgi:hypothetical protein
MSLFRSATSPREGEARAARGDSAVGRLVRFAARTLLWGCVLLLIIRGIFSEFTSTPRTVGPVHGAGQSGAARSLEGR